MKINVIDDKGSERAASIITSFRLSSKSYIIYSFFEKDASDSIRIYISELRVKQNKFSFNNIINDNDWVSVKKVMKEFAKGIENIEVTKSEYDVEAVPIKSIVENNEFVPATIKDSKVVKVSPKFIEGLVVTFKELMNSQTKQDVSNESEIEEEPQVEQTLKEVKKNDIVESETRQKMKDIWEYSSMLQKKIAKDMRTLNSKVVKLDGERYYVDVKDPLYMKEKIELQTPDKSGNVVLKELEPAKSSKKISTDNSIFSQLEKELSGINDNFNKIVAKNQEEKARIASEIEKRLQDVAIKERKLSELEEKLNLKEEELKIREEELLKANERLEDDVRSLTKYASMINSMMNDEER